MAKNTFADLSVTPASNTDLLNQNSTGSANANTIDTLVQNFAGMTARYYGDVGGLGTVGGSANAITLTSQSTYQQYQSGLQIAFKASAANTGAATLNLDGLGVKKIRRRGDTALAANDIIANGRYLLQYDAAYDTAAGAWVLMNPEGMPALTFAPNLVLSGSELRVYELWGGAVSDETTAITTGAAKLSFSIPYNFAVVGVYATLNTVSSSGTPTFDINEGGTSILSTKIVIDANELTGGSAGYQGTASGAAVISDAAIAAFAQVTVDIDVAGTGAKGAKVFIVGYRTA